MIDIQEGALMAGLFGNRRAGTEGLYGHRRMDVVATRELSVIVTTGWQQED